MNKPLLLTEHVRFRMRLRRIPRSVVRYDPSSDTLYIVAGRGEEEFVEVAPGVHVELDAQGEIIGVEILNASKLLRPVAKPLYQHMQMAS